MTVHRFRLEPLAPIREALVASVEQARRKDAMDMWAAFIEASGDLNRAAEAADHDYRAKQSLTALTISAARNAALRVIAACDEYATRAAAGDPEMLTD